MFSIAVTLQWRVHAPVLLQGGTIEQPPHGLGQRQVLHRSTLQLHTARSSCPQPRSPFPAPVLSLCLQRHRGHRRSSGRVRPCCARSPTPRQLWPTCTLAFHPWRRPVCRQSACPRETRARRRASTAPPANVSLYRCSPYSRCPSWKTESAAAAAAATPPPACACAG